MRTQIIEIFTFEELSQESQQKAISAERNNPNRLDYSWYDHIIEDATTYLGFMGFSNVNISFSGFTSQGDGASFVGHFDSSTINLANLESHAPALFSMWKPTLEQLASEKITAELIRRQHSYVHENTVTIGEFAMPTYDDAVDKADSELFEARHIEYLDENGIEPLKAVAEQATKKQKYIYQKFEPLLSMLRTSLCRHIYNTLDTEYAFLMSDEAIREDLIDNGCEFTADGKPYF